VSGQATPHEHPGRIIRERRESLGLSREGLAYKSGVALKTIERIEREENLPRRATLTVITGALDEFAEGVAA
jgi:transcriptional regulator with XRE-family HTH domain